jgi:4-amino-4-deoxy-L-arabinose transferase-like glycosyltransferase
VNRPARSWILPVAIVLVALALRLPGITRWPPAIHQDEASNGVDGWSILTTGADRAGRVAPVFLEGFGAGDNRTSLYAWLTIPGIALFGPGPFATRLPAALAGTWTALATFLLIRRLRGTMSAACAALLIAATPWSIYLSRFGHEASLTPAFLVTALLLASGSRPRWIAAGLVLAAGLYSYPSYRLFLPVLVAAAWIARAEPRPRDRAGWGRLAIAFAAGCVPLGIATLAHPDRLFARGASASAFGNLPIVVAIRVFAWQYLEHFLPRFLFLRGDGNPLHSPAGMGELLRPEILSLPLGIILAVRRRDGWDRLFLAWLLVSPLASALSLGDRAEYVPHSLRAAVALPVFEILSAQGIASAYRFLAARRARLTFSGLGVWWLACGVNLILFLIAFTGPYARSVEPLYHAADVRAIRYLAANRSRFASAVIRAGENDPQIYVYSLLLGLQTPREYQRVEKVVTQTETFHLVRRAGPLFYIHEPADLDRDRAWIGSGTIWALVEPGQLRSGRLLATFPFGDGTPGVEVRELEIPPSGRSPDQRR